MNTNSHVPLIREEYRLRDIDAIKGLGIVLMVIGHSRSPFSNWIYLFHMAVFFVASGYLWIDKHADTSAAIWKYTKKKMKTLWMPYALGNSMFLVLSNMFVNLGLYSNNPYFLEIAGYDNASLIQLMSVKQIIVEVLKSFLFFGGSQLGGALWFLRCMFMVNIVHCCICWVLKRRNWYKQALYLIFMISLGSAWYVSLGHWQFLHGFKTEFAAYAAYLIGIWLKSFPKYKKLISDVRIQIGVLMASFVGLCVLSKYGTISLVNGCIVNPLFFVLATCFGWMMLHSIVLLAKEKGQQIFKHIGKANVQIMVFHFLAFKLVSWIYLLFSERPAILLASFPVIVNVPEWLWIFYSIVGIIVPYAIYRVWGLLKVGFYYRP